MAMIKEHDWTDKQRELYDLMSDISEDCHCAVWYSGNEYHIWAALQAGDPSDVMGAMDVERLEKCRALAKELDGWVVWVDDHDYPGLPADEWGPRFIPMDEWIRMLATNDKE